MIAEGAWKEAELVYRHEIMPIVEKQNIPHSTIVSLNQTSSKYVQS